MDAAFALVREWFVEGGWLMWPILALSVVSVTFSIERAWFWARTHNGSRQQWLARAIGALKAGAGERKQALKLARADKTVYGYFVTELIDQGHSQAVALELVEAVRPRIERFSNVLSTIITAAPILGILGTVVGIIKSFKLLGAGENVVVDPSDVAGGIATALYTTEFGLIVALITLFPYVSFRASADRCFTRLEAILAAAEEGHSNVKGAGGGGSGASGDETGRVGGADGERGHDGPRA